MTRRERLERKLAKREEWAEKRKARAEAAWKAGSDAFCQMDGQPILVGHHSEKRHRNAIKRADAKLQRARESDEMAAHHRSKASGIEAQLDRSIFSDDENAIEALRAKCARLEAQRAKLQAARKKHGKASLPLLNYRQPEGFTIENRYHAGETYSIPQVEMTKAEYKQATRWSESGGTLRPVGARHRIRVHWGGPSTGQRAVYLTDSKDHGKPDESGPEPEAGACPDQWQISNLSQEIARCRKRIQAIEAQQTRSARAEEAGGVAIEARGERWVCVTFAEKPERSVLTALKAAGFRWAQGSWVGERTRLPHEVIASDD